MKNTCVKSNTQLYLYSSATTTTGTMMATWVVKIKYIYSGEIEVEASSKEEAEEFALREDCEEEFESVHEVIATEQQG